MNDLADVVDAQIYQQGASCIRTSDGHVFTFTVDSLRKLLEHAETTGRVVVLVKHGVLQ